MGKEGMQLTEKGGGGGGGRGGVGEAFYKSALLGGGGGRERECSNQAKAVKAKKNLTSNMVAKEEEKKGDRQPEADLLYREKKRMKRVEEEGEEHGVSFSLLSPKHVKNSSFRSFFRRIKRPGDFDEQLERQTSQGEKNRENRDAAT